MNKRMIDRVPVALLVFLAILFAGTSLYAGGVDGGNFLVWETTTISRSGSFVVTRDIHASAGPAISIQAANVTLDLNGFTLSTDDPTAAVVHHVPPAAGGETGHFYLIGGKLKGGAYGFKADPSPPGSTFKLENLHIGGSMEAAVRASGFNSFEARGIIIIDGKVGFDLVSQPPQPLRIAMIAHSSIQADVGIQCTGLTCDIRKNSIVSCSMGIRVNDALLGGTASQNSINVPGSNCSFNPQPEPPAIGVTNSPGYTATHNRINAEAIAAGIKHGIQIGVGSHDAFLMDNEITGFSGDGIQVLANDALIFGNQVNRNGGHGLSIGGANNLVDRNRAANNGGNGLNVSTAGNIYRNNVLLGNNASLGGTGVPDLVNGGGNVE